MLIELKISAESVQELQEILQALGQGAPRVEVQVTTPEPEVKTIIPRVVNSISRHDIPPTKKRRALTGKGCIHLSADGTCWYCGKKDELMYELCDRCLDYKQQRSYGK